MPCEKPSIFDYLTSEDVRRYRVALSGGSTADVGPTRTLSSKVYPKVCKAMPPQLKFINESIMAVLQRREKLKEPTQLLDCGCGDGRMALKLSAALSAWNVSIVGVDIDSAKIAQAKTKGSLAFECASCYDLPFSDDSFDIIYAHALISFLSDPLKALMEIRRVLKPGGFVGFRDSSFRYTYSQEGDPVLDRLLAQTSTFVRARGGCPKFIKDPGSGLTNCGFVDIRRTSTWDGSPPKAMGNFLLNFFGGSGSMGWDANKHSSLSKTELSQSLQAWQLWQQQDDAFFAGEKSEFVAFRPKTKP